MVFDASKLGATPAATHKTDPSKPTTSGISPSTPPGGSTLPPADPGAIYRVDPAKPSATPEDFFKSDEAHIRSLAWDSKGNLIAGSDGSGLVYRISPDGRATCSSMLPAAKSPRVAVAANGTIYAANVGDKSHNPLPPLPVQGMGTVTITIVQPGSLQAANSSTSLPEGRDLCAQRNQAPRKLWAGKDDIVYALARAPMACSPSPEIADTSSASERRQLCRHRPPQRAAGAEPGDLPGPDRHPRFGTGNTGKIFMLGLRGNP